MSLAEIERAAERLYRACLGHLADPAVQVARRDGAERRRLEELAIGVLRAQPGEAAEVGAAILAGAVSACAIEGRPDGTSHAEALSWFRRSGREESGDAGEAGDELRGLHDFLDHAGRPSLWGDTFAAATLDNGAGALFRILAQIELGPARRDEPASGPRVEIDPRFGRDPSRPALMKPVEQAVRAALAYLREKAPGGTPHDVDRVAVVRIFRGGLPWPLVRDPRVPSRFENEQEEGEHGGPSIGLPVALAVLHAFLRQWTLRRGPLTAATGYVSGGGDVAPVGPLARKWEAVRRAGVPFLFPAQEEDRPPPRYGDAAVSTLEAAVAAAFRLTGSDVTGFLGAEPDPIVGRADERRQLDQAWARSRSSGPRLALVRGPEGIGKSHLVGNFVADAARAGTPVLFAKADPDVTHFAAIGARVVDGVARRELLDRGPVECAWLAQLVEPFAEFVREEWDEPHAGGGAVPAREVVFSRKSGALGPLVREAASERSGVVIVLDDLHLAREETWAVLRDLVDPKARGPIFVVAALRPNPAEFLSNDAPAELATMRSRGVVDELEIGPLPTEAVASWVHGTVAPDAAQARRIAATMEEYTAGNALATSTHIRQLREHLASAGGAPDLLEVVRASGRDVIAQRLGAFGGLATLKLAATVRGPEFSARLLAETGLVDGNTLQDDLAAARASGFIKPAGFGRYTFWHSETRQATRDLTPDAERARHCLALAETLERLAAQDGETPPAPDLAHYYADAAAVTLGDEWKPALAYAGRAADDFTRRWLYESVVEYRELALEAFLLSGRTSPSQHARLLLDAARAHSYAGREAEGRAQFDEARDLGHEAGDDALVVDATLGYAGPPEDTGRLEDRLIRLLREAERIARRTRDARRAALDGRVTFELVLAARRDPELYVMPPVLETLARAEAEGDPVAIAWAQLARLMGLWVYTEPTRDRLALAERMHGQAEGCGERDIAAWAHGFRVIHHLELAERKQAEEAAEDLAGMGPELHHGYARWGEAVLQPVFAFLDGELAESRRLADKALALRPESHTSVIYWRLQQMLAWREEGDFAPISRQLESLEEGIGPVTPASGMPTVFRGGWATLYCDLGRDAEAQALLDELFAHGMPDSSDDALWTTALAFLAEACGTLDDARLAGTLYDVFKVKEGEAVVIALAIACLGAVDRYLGILAGVDGQWEAAERHFEAALHINRVKLRSPIWEARTQVDYAGTLARRGRSQDMARARSLVSAAEATWQSRGLPNAWKRSRRALSRLG